MIREHRNDVAAIAEHFLGKSLQRLLRSDLDEDARPSFVQCLQALYKLHRRSDLLREEVQHLRNNIRTGGIKLPVNVGDDWHAGWLYMQVGQHLTQWFASGSDDRGVKSVADRQWPYVVASLQEDLHSFFHGLAGATNDRLLSTVYVGDHHVIVNGL